MFPTGRGMALKHHNAVVQYHGVNCRSAQIGHLDILRPNCEYMHCEEFARFLMVLVVAPVLPFPADSFFVDKLNVSGKSDCIVLKSYSRRSKHILLEGKLWIRSQLFIQHRPTPAFQNHESRMHFWHRLEAIFVSFWSVEPACFSSRLKTQLKTRKTCFVGTSEFIFGGVNIMTL